MRQAGSYSGGAGVTFGVGWVGWRNTFSSEAAMLTAGDGSGGVGWMGDGEWWIVDSGWRTGDVAAGRRWMGDSVWQDGRHRGGMENYRFIFLY